MNTAKLGLGTVQWGTRYGIANRTGQPGDGVVCRMLAMAANAGVDTLDTARAYGESESVIGRVAPHCWNVVTKLEPSASTALDSLRASRTSLNRTVLNTVLLHRPAQKQTRAWDELRRERDAGRIGIIGISAVEPDDAWDALDDPEVTAIQVAASLLDQRLFRSGFFDAAIEKQIYVRSAYLQGAGLMEPELLPVHLEQLREPIRKIRKWSTDNGLSLEVPFLAHLAGMPGITVLVGCETAVQLHANLVAWETASNGSNHVRKLADSIPELPAEVLNPARWPRN